MRTFQGRSPRIRRFRFLAPAGVFAVIAGAAWIPTLRASASPTGLPDVSAAQLLVDAHQAKMPPLSGTLRWTANLGLSDLSALQSELGAQGGSSTAGFNPATLLSGSHTINLWLGARAEHLSLSDGVGAETDLVRNANSLWLWDSTSQQAEHLILSAKSAGARGHRPARSTTAPNDLTPQQEAGQLLTKAGTTTTVTVGPPAYVAGQAAYQLILTPVHQGGSTVSKVTIDLGAKGALRGVPLQVAVYAVGVAQPALELGFTGTIRVGQPPASQLTFAAPPGATVKTRTLAPGQSPMGGSTPVWANAPAGSTPAAGHTIGSGWSAVAVLPSGAGSSSVSPLPAQLSALTTTVTVKGQTDRLLQTDLLNALLLPDGTVYAGLVTPATLEAAASTGS